MSDTRSGSTLLDQLLGAHAEIRSVGEVHHLAAYALEDRSRYDPVHQLVCSCGHTVSKCQFWSSVEARLARSLGSLVLRPRLFRTRPNPDRLLGKLLNLPRRILVQHPHLIRYQLIANLLDGQQVAADSFALFDAIFAMSSEKFIVDSSKQSFRFRLLYDYQPTRVILIMLARDYRGTVYSRVKRGRDLKRSTQSWVSKMMQMEAMADDVPRDQLIRVKYEDLCSDPKKFMDRLCNFLEIDFSKAMMSRPSLNVHHLGGSPSKFDPAKTTIRLDESHIGAFSEDELLAMRDMVQHVAKLWNYE